MTMQLIRKAVLKLVIFNIFVNIWKNTKIPVYMSLVYMAISLCFSSADLHDGRRGVGRRNCLNCDLFI